MSNYSFKSFIYPENQTEFFLKTGVPGLGLLLLYCAIDECQMGINGKVEVIIVVCFTTVPEHLKHRCSREGGRYQMCPNHNLSLNSQGQASALASHIIHGSLSPHYTLGICSAFVCECVFTVCIFIHTIYCILLHLLSLKHAKRLSLITFSAHQGNSCIASTRHQCMEESDTGLT